MTVSRTKICFMVDSPYAGGAERYVGLIARGLDRSRFEACLITADVPGLDDWCRHLQRHEMPVTRVTMRVPFRPWQALSIWRALRSAAPDIVHINMPGPYDGQMGLLAPIARLAGAKAVVVTEHLPMVERLWKRAAVKRLAFRWVTRVLTICQANVPFLIQRQRVPAERIEVVYNGVPEFGAGLDRQRERSRLNLPMDTSAIVFIGSLIERKGVGELIAAASGIPQPDWKLLIAGRGEDEARFKDQARTSDAPERIAFLGQLEEAEIAGLLAAADLLVLPSFMEGMPYVILEAMASSVPVVASCVNGIPEAVDDGVSGLLAPPGDTEALRRSIETLLADHQQRRRFGQAGRERFEEMFTLERHLSAMQTLYDSLISNRGGSEPVA